jgi:phage shock protein A
MTTRRPGLLARFTGLLRGLATGWLRAREEENPRAVYEQAIAERVAQYRELKDAVAGILYMRNKLEAELVDRRADLARTHEDIRRAVRRGDDEVGLALISHKQILVDDLARTHKEWQGLRDEAEEAKGNLVRFREEIRALEREKGRIVATLANAKARRRMSEALEGISVDADMRALDAVREHVARLQTAGTLDRELGGDIGLEARVRAIREEAHQEAARRELDELKRQLRPVALPAASSAVGAA